LPGLLKQRIDDAADSRSKKSPPLVTAFVTVAVVILFNDFNSDTELRTSGKARAIAAAPVSRADAIEIPSEQPVGWKISWATQFTNRNPTFSN
jgi:hypothetical protein